MTTPRTSGSPSRDSEKFRASLRALCSPYDGSILVSPEDYAEAVEMSIQSARSGVTLIVFSDPEILIEWRARIARRQGLRKMQQRALGLA